MGSTLLQMDAVQIALPALHQACTARRSGAFKPIVSNRCSRGKPSNLQSRSLAQQLMLHNISEGVDESRPSQQVTSKPKQLPTTACKLGSSRFRPCLCSISEHQCMRLVPSSSACTWFQAAARVLGSKQQPRRPGQSGCTCNWFQAASTSAGFQIAAQALGAKQQRSPHTLLLPIADDSFQ